MTREKERTRIPLGHFRVFTFGSPAQAEAEWHAVRADFIARRDLWGIPAIWWRFELDVPDDIRQVRTPS